MNSEAIAYVKFVDGRMRPVFENANCCQFVIDVEDQRSHGIWHIPRELECDCPVIVDPSDAES